MSTVIQKPRKNAIAEADEKLLAQLGYKQEFQRAFTSVEVCSLSRHLQHPQHPPFV